MFQSQERHFGDQQGHFEGTIDCRPNDNRAALDQNRENRWGQAVSRYRPETDCLATDRPTPCQREFQRRFWRKNTSWTEESD